jgi:hypothetical protein
VLSNRICTYVLEAFCPTAPKRAASKVIDWERIAYSAPLQKKRWNYPSVKVRENVNQYWNLSRQRKNLASGREPRQISIKDLKVASESSLS